MVSSFEEKKKPNQIFKKENTRQRITKAEYQRLDKSSDMQQTKTVLGIATYTVKMFYFLFQLNQGEHEPTFTDLKHGLYYIVVCSRLFLYLK